MSIPYKSALIIGAGSGISASLARALHSAGINVALAARDTEKLKPLAEATNALAVPVDASDPASVLALFTEVDREMGEPDIVVYNASARVRGSVVELDPAAVQAAFATTAFGGFLAGQQAAKRMLPKRNGAILFTGATASIKGFPNSGAFAMGKFALRGLAQSMARELGPQGIHVAHFIIDGAVRSEGRPESAEHPDSTLDPQAIAETYLSVLRQPRNAWSQEIELRPWVEKF